MRKGDVVLGILPLIAGGLLLLFRFGELRFYSLESPLMWSFLAFGVSIGIFIMATGKDDRKALLGVPVE